MMLTIPLELPVRAGDAAALAGLIYQQIEGRPLDDDLRGQLNARIAGLQLSSILPLAGSLQRDPIHPSSYYIVAYTSGIQLQTVLLRLAPASSPSSGLFPKDVLIGRMHAGAPHEVVVNAIPFSPTDRDNIWKFAERVDTEFLPRPRGAAAGITVVHEHPETTLPCSFDAYRSILQSTNVNLASVLVKDEAAVDAAIWAAICAGWRAGYTIEAEIETWEHILPHCSKYSAKVRRRPEELLETYDAIRKVSGRKFDFEIEGGGAALRFLRSHGRPAHFVSTVFETGGHLAELAAIARQLAAMIPVRSESLLPADTLVQIGKITAGRVNYKFRSPGTNGPDMGRLIVSTAERLRT